jgi:dihydroorotate dehydrogenase (NAD+) catalytic subunit
VGTVARVKPTLAVDLGGLRLPTPVMIASGCFSSPKEVSGLLDLRKVGGIVTRSITLEPNLGAPPPRMAETASGLLSSIGLQNPGVDVFLEELASLAKIGVPVFVSIAGEHVEEYMRVAARIVATRAVSALELNLSAPNAGRGGRLFACDADQSAAVVAAVSGVSRVPVFAKLTAESADIVEVAKACVSAGAHGITLINTISGLAVDPATGRPRLASGVGGLSGPAIKPIALLAVHRVAEALPHVPHIGVGGVSSAEDALEFLSAGASAVQVGTAMLANPAAPVDVAVGIGRHLVAAGLRSPGEITGRAHGGAAEEGT